MSSSEEGGEPPSRQIVDYDLFTVPPRWLFLRLETSDGTVGWGEPSVEGRLETAAAAVGELVETHLLGAEPSRIEHHWQTLYRGGFHRGGPVLLSALAGIDQALWDIKGRTLGVPVATLLGGRVRERVRLYQWIGGDDLAELAAEAEAAVDRGFSALKLNPVEKLRPIDSPAAVETASARVGAVREAVGQDVDVAVDLHGRVATPMARRLVAALDEHDPMFVEEPVLPEHGGRLSDLRDATTAPIAVGERCYSRFDFEPLFAAGTVDVVQPHVSHAGGISEVHRIAAAAETHDVTMVAHCPLGPISLAASLQVAACSPAVSLQEISPALIGPDGDGLRYLEATDAFTPSDGTLPILDGPGLGIDVDEAAVRAETMAVGWHNPVWHHDDGSLAEW